MLALRRIKSCLSSRTLIWSDSAVDGGWKLRTPTKRTSFLAMAMLDRADTHDIDDGNGVGRKTPVMDNT